MSDTPYDHEQEGELVQRPDGNLEREPVTHDAEVLPIAVNFDARQQAQPNSLLVALSENFGIEAEQITGFIAAVEYTKEDGVTLSSVWSTGVPAWRLRAFAAELTEHLKQV